jgi:thioredoxin reductase (NADPH)
VDDSGYIITNNGTSHTKTPGLFACGDVQDKVYRQAITAAGTGCVAAIDSTRWLEGKND